MWLPRVVTVAPVAEPVSLAEAKAHCRVDDTGSDALITSLIVAARQHVEQYTGLAIPAQTIEVRCSDWCDLRALPVAPLVSVSSIKYLDGTATELMLAPTQYVLIGAGALQPSIGKAYNALWPTVFSQADAIRVVVTAGFSPIPQPLKAAMLLLIGQWFEQREAVAVDVKGVPTELPNSVEALLSNYRVYA